MDDLHLPHPGPDRIEITFLASLVIAAGVAPYRSRLRQVDRSKHAPARIGRLISTKSRSNDGIIFSFLYMALYLLLDANQLLYKRRIMLSTKKSTRYKMKSTMHPQICRIVECATWVEEKRSTCDNLGDKWWKGMEGNNDGVRNERRRETREIYKREQGGRSTIVTGYMDYTCTELRGHTWVHGCTTQRTT